MTSCRICNTPLTPFMSFGEMPIANGFLTPEAFSGEYFFELATACCKNCHMFQLIEQPAPEVMFHENYAFFSQTSKGMIAHFKSFSEDIQNHYIKHTDPFVVELGSNDGILLQHFAKANIRHLGVEPSANVAEAARKNGVNTLCAFFSEQTAKEVIEQHGHADIVTAANVMCHIPDFVSIAKGISLLLKDDGVLVFEDPYLGDVITKTSYDQIYDEHVFLFCVNSINNTFRQVGMEVIDALPQVTHGGSMRYVLAKSGEYPIHDRVEKQLKFEKDLGLEKPETYEKFRKNCEASKEALLALLTDLANKNQQVVGYAATSKSTTVMNYCNITPEHIQYISDTTPIKQGKFSPGVHIPIKPYEIFKESYPDFALLFAWNHSQEIFQKEQAFSASGGQWIVFVPEVKILEFANSA